MIRLLFLLAVPLAAQTVTFSPSPEALGPFMLYGVRICNQGQAPTTLRAADLYAEAQRQQIALATYSQIQRAVDGAQRRSWQRNVLLVIEISGGVLTALMATDQVKISEKYKAAIPTVAGGLALAQHYIKPAEIAVPPDLFPASGVILGAGECREFSAPGNAFTKVN